MKLIVNNSDTVFAANEDSARSRRLPVNLSVDGKFILFAKDAATFLDRLRGLHAILPLAGSEALIIKPCNAIHTFTMRQPIDALFLSGEGVILEICTLQRWRWRSVASAAVVIEMNAGVCKRLGIGLGDRIDRDSGEWV